jgi:hypothetical protein
MADYGFFQANKHRGPSLCSVPFIPIIPGDWESAPCFDSSGYPAWFLKRLANLKMAQST